MERSSAPPKKKKKKDPQPPIKEISSKKPPADDKQATVSNKSYPYISPETVTKIAESVGIAGLADDISVNLAEDVSYKLLEIIHSSCTIMRRCKRRKLLTSDVSTALRMSDCPPVFGHAGDELFNFVYVPEADIHVGEDYEVDLTSVALGTQSFVKSKPTYVATSWPMLKSVQKTDLNKTSGKSDDKSNFAVPYSKPVAVNGDLKQDSPGSQLNSVKGSSYDSVSKSQSFDSSRHIVKAENQEISKSSKKNSSSSSSLVRDTTPQKFSSIKTNGRMATPVANSANADVKPMSPTNEEEVQLSSSQQSYFNVVASCILQGPESHFREVLTDLRTNNKLGLVVSPLLNLVAHTVNHVRRHFGLTLRLLDTVDALLCNQHVNPSFSIAVNRLVNALLAITSDQNVVSKGDDFLLRRKAAMLLARAFAEWNIEEQHVSELLSRLALVLGDVKEPIQSRSQYGALVIFHALGASVLFQWLMPLLHTYLPQLEQRIKLSAPSTTVHMEEIRGVMLDIVELIHSRDNSSRIHADNLNSEEVQALVELDNLLYHHIGDAVCSRRQSFVPRTVQKKPKSSGNSDNVEQNWLSTDAEPKSPPSNLFNIRFIGNSSGSTERRGIQPGDFEEQTHCTPINRRKDIHFRFAGANPVPKERLKRRLLDRTHAQYVPHIHGPLHSLYQRQYSMVGRKHRISSNPSSKSRSTLYSPLTIL